MERRCTVCRRAGARRDGLCCRCWCERQRKYVFSPELLDRLRRVQCSKKGELREGLRELERATGWPRWAFAYEAIRRGWTRSRRPWTVEEIDRVRELLGTMSVKRIAVRLGRTHEAVQALAERLKLSRRVRDGYTGADLVQVLGEHHSKVQRWLGRGLFGRRRDGRVGDREVYLFLRRHTSEYDLRRVDQEWFKSMMFGALSGS